MTRFKNLSIGERFRFASEEDPRFLTSGMMRGPWVKTGVRSYRTDPDNGLKYRVGTVNVEVLPETHRNAAMLQRGAYTFHGSFTSKLAAAKKEAKTPGSFVYEKEGRYYVLKPKGTRRTNKTVLRTSQSRSRRSSNPGRKLIYDKITRVEGTKGKGSKFAGEKFYHNFKRPFPQMWGLPDGSLLITSKG